MKRWSVAAGLLATLAMALPLSAGVVGKVEFQQQGKHPLAEELLEYNIRLRPGMEYDRDIVDADIKRLFGTGNFADVSSRISIDDKGQTDVTFLLTLRPRLREVNFAGNEKFSDKDLQELVLLERYAPLNDTKLGDTLKKIREFYHAEGYTEAVVTADFSKNDDESISLTIKIRENLRRRVRSLGFTGVTAIPENELSAVVVNRPVFWAGLPVIRRYASAGLFDAREIRADRARLRECYLNRGYLDCRIGEPVVTPLADDPEYVDVVFPVEEGKPYQVSAVDVTTTGAIPRETLAELVLLRAGEPFSLAVESDSASAISDYCESLGHADVTVRPVHVPDLDNQTVAVRLEVTEGRRYLVSGVNISGNTGTKDKVIRRELAIQPGDPVDRNRIEASRARLMGMGYFTDVTATVTNAEAIDEKDVTFRVEEKPGIFDVKVGAGFSDMNNLVGMAEITSNNFDISDPGSWFHGGGQRLRLRGLFGVETYGGNIDFTEPWLFDMPLRLDVSGYWNEVEYDYWNEERLGARFGLNHKLFDDFTSITFGYKIEQVNVKDMSRKVAPETYRERGREWVSQFSLLLERDTRDSLVFPTEGYNIALSGAISPRALGSSSNFYRLEGRASGYYPLFDKAIIVMGGLRAGVVSGFPHNDNVPIFERYFLGGGDSIRGFEYRTVSPLDDNGKPRGGQTMLVGTVEISHPIWRWIRGAAFFDVGNTWEASYNFSGGINAGAGYGLRLLIPMLNAPVRLDLAYPIIKDNDLDNVSRKLRFHFNMGFTIY